MKKFEFEFQARIFIVAGDVEHAEGMLNRFLQGWRRKVWAIQDVRIERVSVQGLEFKEWLEKNKREELGEKA